MVLFLFLRVGGGAGVAGGRVHFEGSEALDIGEVVPSAPVYSGKRVAILGDHRSVTTCDSAVFCLHPQPARDPASAAFRMRSAAASSFMDW